MKILSTSNVRSQALRPYEVCLLAFHIGSFLSTETSYFGSNSVIGLPLGASNSHTMPASRSGHPANPTILLASFAIVYIVWGSTFYAIRVGIESFPPFLLAGLRHLSVGLVFYPAFRIVSRERPTLAQWRTTFITGCLLLAVGNGTVSWAEKTVPSGIAALLVDCNNHL